MSYNYTYIFDHHSILVKCAEYIYIKTIHDTKKQTHSINHAPKRYGNVLSRVLEAVADNQIGKMIKIFTKLIFLIGNV